MEPEIIAGIYEIDRQIGSGGGGIVYLGRHRRLEKQVVLKADKRTLSTDTEVLRREVDLLKGLSHTYIPQVYDFVQNNGIVYTVMDFIEGESLDKLLGRGQIPSQPQVIKWAGQLLQALCYLHGRPPYGILHGDIKPANIMLRPNGDICLIDFNIALALGEEGAVKVGFSRGYASPEHYGADYIKENRSAAVRHANSTDGTDQGNSKTIAVQENQSTEKIDEDDLGRTLKIQHEKAVVETSSQMSHGRRDGLLLDVRSDIYSLGATLYHLLSGTRPAQDARDVVPLAEPVCSHAVSVIIQKAMNPEPAMRYQTAEEMLTVFQQLHKRDIRTVRHKRRMVFAGILCSALFLAGGASAFIGLKQLEQRQTALTLAEYSANALAQGDVSSAVEQALQAIPEGKSILEAPVTAQAQKALTDALGVYDLSDGFKSAGTIALPGAPFDISMSPGGTRLAVVYGYGAAVFDLESQSRIVALQIQDSALSDCLFTDEDHVIYAGQGGVALYDLAAGQDVWTGETATTLAVSGDGSIVAAVDRDGDHAVIYDTADGSVKGKCYFHGAHMAVAVNDIFADPKDYVFALNGDGSLLAVSFSGGGLTVFDLEDSEGDMILYEESEYGRFQGGFCGKYFVFAADGETAQFGLVDTEAKVFAGGLESRDGFLLEADEGGIYLGSGNVLVRLDSDTLEELEVAYTGSLGMTGFAVDGSHALVATEDSGFSFYNSAASLMSTEGGELGADFLALAGGYAVIGNRTETKLRIMRLEGHEDTQIAAYDARYVHEEARVSADGESVMLFDYKGFRIYGMDGKLMAEMELPEAESIYDQQFRREGDASFLEVIWYDGTRRCYSASDGTLMTEETGEAPEKDLYEEFFVKGYRITSNLQDAPVVYEASSGREVTRLEEDGYLTYVTELGDCLVTEYIDTEGERYGLLLDSRFEVIARLPGLCDVIGDELVFDYGDGSLRKSQLYSLQKLVEMGKAYLDE